MDDDTGVKPTLATTPHAPHEDHVHNSFTCNSAVMRQLGAMHASALSHNFLQKPSSGQCQRTNAVAATLWLSCGRCTSQHHSGCSCDCMVLLLHAWPDYLRVSVVCPNFLGPLVLPVLPPTTALKSGTGSTGALSHAALPFLTGSLLMSHGCHGMGPPAENSGKFCIINSIAIGSGGGSGAVWALGLTLQCCCAVAAAGAAADAELVFHLVDHLQGPVK